MTDVVILVLKNLYWNFILFVVIIVTIAAVVFVAVVVHSRRSKKNHVFNIMIFVIYLVCSGTVLVEGTLVRCMSG